MNFVSAFAVHITATTRHRVSTLLRPGRAGWLWRHLRAAVPDALSLVLMPDHLHMVVPPERVATVRRVLAGYTRVFGVQFDLAYSEATTPAIAGRQMRYGFFNPVRAGYVDDPFAWPWSTLRELVDAAFPAWTSLPEIADALGWTPERVLRALTHTADFQAALPQRRAVEMASWDRTLRAVAVVLREEASDVLASTLGRRVVAQTTGRFALAPTVRELAGRMGVTPRQVHRLREDLHPAVAAVELCLSDDRLLRDPGLGSRLTTRVGSTASSLVR